MLAMGACLLRANCTETDPAKLWRWYIQLAQVEASFCSAKSDIGQRPIAIKRPDAWKPTC